MVNGTINEALYFGAMAAALGFFLSRSMKRKVVNDEYAKNGPKNPRIFTMSDVRISNSLTVIDNKVYDVSRLGHHPGGSIIRTAVGRNSTAMFYSYHLRHERAEARLKSLYVGELQEKEHTLCRWNKETVLTPLYTEIKNELKVALGDHRRGGIHISVKAVLHVFAVLMGFVIYPYLGPFFCVYIGMIYALIGFNIQHDANHAAFSKSSWVNDLGGWFADFIGNSSLHWSLKHQTLHHVDTNLVGEDPDVDSDWLLRLHPASEKVGNVNNFQAFYFPFLYAFSTLRIYVVTLTSILYSDDPLLYPMNTTVADKIWFIVGKLLGGACLMGPSLMHGDGLFMAIFTFVAGNLVGGFYLAICFELSHVCSFALGKKCLTDWARHQILTSCNWSVGSLYWLFMVGGLNYQIEHHLFPGICHTNYPTMSPIVEKTCRKYNIPYNNTPTWTALVLDHMNTMHAMGKGWRLNI